MDLSAPEEACSRNVRASVTQKFGYEGVFKIYYTGMHERIRIYGYKHKKESGAANADVSARRIRLCTWIPSYSV